MPNPFISRRALVRWLGGATALTALGGTTKPSGAVGRTPHWLSGASDPAPGSGVQGDFSRWRGDPCTYTRIWADASLKDMAEVWGLTTFTRGDWSGTLDIACGGPRDGLSWRDAAEGRMDSLWTTACRRIRRGWGDLSAVHLSMAHEANGTWYPWSVTNGNVNQFRRAWARWHGVVQRELVDKGKNVKVCLNLNSDTVNGLSVRAMLPALRYVDVLGCDFYSMWPDLRTLALWEENRASTRRDGSPRGIEAWRAFAVRINKPLSFPEWGVNPQRHSDNPYFISKMNAFFAAHAPAVPSAPKAGELAGEAYFNNWSTCRLWPNTDLPETAHRYRSLRWGS